MVQLSRWKVILVVLSIVFGALFALPNMLTPAQRDALPDFLPKGTLNLGLDLRGGSYLLLEVDTEEMRIKRVGAQLHYWRYFSGLMRESCRMI